jgi:3-dehydroquinate synthase
MNELKSSFGYTIYFDDAIKALDKWLSEQSYSKVAILGDTHTLEQCLPYLNLYSSHTSKYDLIEIDPGEDNKNIDICIGVWSMMQEFGLDRKSLLINLGGGVITDMGGFAASTYMRGIDFINIPTTLLAMVDASIGGKTGLDLQNYKNHLGTFEHPKAIFIVPEFLSTLHELEIKSGFAEIIKHGLIADHLHLRDALCYLDNGLPGLDVLIPQSIKIKSAIVEKDPFEKDVRKVLNFGHTVGHAIETYYLNKGKLIMHGSAIACGMMVESFLSVEHCHLPVEDLKYILEIIPKHLEPAKLNEGMILDLIELMRKDKKNESSEINFSLLQSIANPQINVKCSEEKISEAIIKCIHYFNGDDANK